MSGGWRIELLGELRATRDPWVVSRFRSQKASGLLGYLAYRPGVAHAREVLVEVLWPGSSPEAGRSNLSRELSSLRHQLEPPGVEAGSVIAACRAAVELVAGAVTTDVSELQALLDQADRAEGPERRALLARAIALYRGELLAGHYQDWIENERERLRATFVHTVRELTAELRANADPSRALDYARRALAADPLSEQAHRDVMLLHEAIGEPQAALRHYAEMLATFERELGGPPSGATVALAREIERRAGAPAPRLEPRPRPLERREAASMPAGTVTFLVAGVEGGTADALRPLLPGHHGEERVGPGDVLTAAFARASEAVACALALHRTLPGRRGRVVLDTGEVDPGGEATRRIEDRARALALVARAGEITCSEETAALSREGLGAAVRLVDMGVFRVTGDAPPRRLLAVREADDPSPLQPPDAERVYGGNLPLRLSGFFGRGAELATLAAELRPGATRLTTITGPGGIGKTRLAVEAASRLLEPYQGSVWYVPLADVVDPRLVAPAIAGALGLERSPAVEPLELVERALARGPSLLVLDNMEQLVAGATEVVIRLLARAPALACLVTSRSCLGVSGEREMALAPLALPRAGESPEELLENAGVRLFVDRARAVRPDFQVSRNNAAAVGELVRRLEGIPLALTLAAGRAQVLGPEQLVARLPERLDLLASRRRDVPPRHRTLRAAIEWSYLLLAPELRRFLARLSVFRGGFAVEAAEAVAEEPRALDLLEDLRECSLLGVAAETPGPRWVMLDVIRDYARERLASEDDAPAARRRHAACFLALAEEAVPKLQGPDQQAWLDRLEADYGNFVAALEWCREDAPSAETGLAIALALYDFLRVRRAPGEGCRLLEDALARSASRTNVRAKALAGAGAFEAARGDNHRARAFFEESLAIARELGDPLGIARSLNNVSIMQGMDGDLEAARASAEECLAIGRSLGKDILVAPVLHNLAGLAQSGGRYAEARARFEESLAVSRRLGDPQSVAFCLFSLGTFLVDLGEETAARACLAEALGSALAQGDERLAALARASLGFLADRLGDRPAARALAAEAIERFRALGLGRELANTLALLAANEAREGDMDAARRHCDEALSHARAVAENIDLDYVLVSAAHVRAIEGDLAAARALLAEALGYMRRVGPGGRPLPRALELLALVEQRSGDAERAARLLGASASLRTASGFRLPPGDEGDLSALRAALVAVLGEGGVAALAPPGPVAPGHALALGLREP